MRRSNKRKKSRKKGGKEGRKRREMKEEGMQKKTPVVIGAVFDISNFGIIEFPQLCGGGGSERRR
jgi:hypothetical protein